MFKPRTVENAHANSTMKLIFMCGDSNTVFWVWKWRLATASTFGKMLKSFLVNNFTKSLFKSKILSFEQSIAKMVEVPLKLPTKNCT